MKYATPIKLELINGESVSGYIDQELIESFDQQTTITIKTSVHHEDENQAIHTIDIPAEVILSADFYLK